MTTELAKTNPRKELKDWLQGETFKRELSALLPKTMSAERFVRIAFQAVHRNPELLKCTQESFFNCLLQLGTMGLEPDGRRSHLIPYGSECTLIVDYKGIAEVLRRNHDVSSLHCDVVYTRDEYDAEQGTDQHLRHKRAHGDRGIPILAYSYVRLPDGSQEFEEMTIGEIEAVRKRSKTPNKGPWVTDWDAMARKSVFRKHAKMLPLSPESRDMIERDDDGDALAEPGFANAVPAKAVVAEPATQRPRGRLPKEVAQDNEPFSPVEPALTTPQTTSQKQPEQQTEAPASAAPPKLTLAQAVSEKLGAAGFKPSELIAILVPVRLADPKFIAVNQLSDHALRRVLEDWDNAVRRMSEERSKNPSQDEIPM